jgi:hypothetical protein
MALRFHFQVGDGGRIEPIAVPPQLVLDDLTALSLEDLNRAGYDIEYIERFGVSGVFEDVEPAGIGVGVMLFTAVIDIDWELLAGTYPYLLVFTLGGQNYHVWCETLEKALTALRQILPAGDASLHLHETTWFVQRAHDRIISGGDDEEEELARSPGIMPIFTGIEIEIPGYYRPRTA